MTIRAIINSRDNNVISVTSDQKVSDVVQLLTDKHIGAVPVVENGAVVGIFSERDVIHCLSTNGAAALDMLVADVMTSPAITVDSNLAALNALSLMTRRRIRHLPVVDGDQLTGFISIGDLVKYRIDRIEAEANAMRDYIQGVT